MNNNNNLPICLHICSPRLEIMSSHFKARFRLSTVRNRAEEQKWSQYTVVTIQKQGYERN